MLHTKCREIGTSRGIIIPRHILEEAHISVNDTLEIDFCAEDSTIKIKKYSSNKPRQNWDLAFKKLHEANEDELLIPDIFENENFDGTI
ncbi:MAG: toxin-antitoxin module transcriptional modulator MazE [Burkholderiales bacterium]|jgi:antitoxin MazE|nr:toxin-antitoxin module transcriptional modulator MazE [Burkholderiales bacterium]